MALTKRQNKLIQDFIVIYKSEDCLWRVKNNKYHNRLIKQSVERI